MAQWRTGGEKDASPIWLRDPLGILAEDAAGGVVVEGGTICELVPRGQKPGRSCEIFDASAHVVVPGLINTHHHFFQTLTRAFPGAIDRTLFPWLTALYPVWSRLTTDALESAVMVAMAELLLSGCTTTTDHHYLFPPALDQAIDIEAEVASRLGIRAILTRGSMNLSQKDGGLPPDNVVQDEDTILADSERLIAKYHDPAPGALLQIALAPCSPFSVTTSLMRETAAMAERYRVRLHTHLAETPDEDSWCEATYGQRPLDYLEECGWLHSGTWLAHGVHFKAEEIVRLGRAGVAVTHCPCSNQLLASGHCQVCALEDAGVRVGLGVDGCASNDASNLMQEVRAALLLQRHHYGISRASHLDALRWGTEGSAACIGRPELGRIAPGAAADLALFKLDELRFAGAGDPLAALVLCGAHRADRVMIGGSWRVIDGMIPGLDLKRLIDRQNNATATLLQ